MKAVRIFFMYLLVVSYVHMVTRKFFVVFDKLFYFIRNVMENLITIYRAALMIFN